jgi:hypothetical protein
MSDNKGNNNSGGKDYDPFDSWRTLRDAGMDAWAKTMIEYVNSEMYTQATGAMLESCLTTSAPFRELLEKTMTRVLEQLSMPSRGDFVSLAQRLTNIEMKLDDLDAKLDKLTSQFAEASFSRTNRREKR